MYLDCPAIKCDLDCEFGLEKDPNTKCEICKCADPCKVSKRPYTADLYD